MRELRIGDAISRADLPFEEVSEEIDRFVAAMDSTAARAQLLWEALEDTPPARVEARLAEVRAGGGQPELEEALATQLGDPAADGEAARALLRRDGADPGRARHRALAARVGVGVVASRSSRPSSPPTCARCASGWARPRRGWRRRSSREARGDDPGSCPGPARRGVDRAASRRLARRAQGVAAGAGAALQPRRARCSGGRRTAPRSRPGGGELIDRQYAGPKAALRPIYERVAEVIAGFADVEVGPRGTYVSFGRPKQFALVQPSTQDAGRRRACAARRAARAAWPTRAHSARGTSPTASGLRRSRTSTPSSRAGCARAYDARG